VSAVVHAIGCPARPCFEQYHSTNSAGVNFTRIRCGSHHGSARALNGYDPFRCVVFNPNACTCHAQQREAA
jgi:hypothetical protein